MGCRAISSGRGAYLEKSVFAWEFIILLGIYFAWLDEIYAYTRVWGYIVALLGILADDEMIV
jgi:hypothetical protein